MNVPRALATSTELRAVLPSRLALCTRARALPRPLVTRRTLQLALALVWLLDGALQLQPVMFTRRFADGIIGPAASGQPGVVADLVHFSATLIGTDPVLWNALFASTQLTIAVALVSRRTVRLGVAASVAWSLGVWVFGEGLGGIAGGSATFITGAPGAAVLYAVVACAAWPRLSVRSRGVLLSRSKKARVRAAALFTRARDELPPTWIPGAWAAVWVLFAVLQALPGGDSGRALGAQLGSGSSGAPGWLAHAQASVTVFATQGGLWLVVALAALEATVGLVALRRGTLRRVAGAIGIALALAVWVLGQAFGQMTTGMATDPSSGPLVVLLGVALLSSTKRRALGGLSVVVWRGSAWT